MSRCFPFPPPGYEKKSIIGDIDLLKKKLKEKKHKKDKSRDKKESKDKKDKERSKGKHREKEEHREKHKDKKDRKKKHKDREKSHESCSSKSKPEVQLKYVNGAKLNSKVLRTQNHGSGVPNHLHESAMQIRVETEATGSRIVQKTTVIDQGKNNGAMGSNHLQVLAKRIGEKEKDSSGGQILQKIRLMDQRKVRIPTRMDVRNGCLFPEEPNGKEKDELVDNRTVNGSKYFEAVNNFKNVAAAYGGLDGKDFRNNKESDCNMDNHTNQDQDMESESKVEDRGHEAKAKEAGELSYREPKIIKERSNLNDSGNIKTPVILAARGKFEAGERNLGKRKELEINGFLHEEGNRLHKLKRPVISSQPAMQNGKKLEPCQTNDLTADSDVPTVINGLSDAQLHKINSRSPLLLAVKAGEIDEASIRPSHPDSIRLNEILSLAEINKVPDFDDQEWLFCKTSCNKPSKMDETDSSEEDVLWNKAITIESADISALPYVVPY